MSTDRNTLKNGLEVDENMILSNSEIWKKLD